MSVQVENLEKNMAKLTIEVDQADFEAACQQAYLKNKGKLNVHGFRKGKAPRSVIEKLYGAEIFYEDAANICIPDAYDKAAKESGLVIVSQPDIDVVTIGKGQPFVFTATVAVKPEVTLGEYKGIKVEKVTVEVTDAEVDERIEKTRQQNARIIPVSDRAAAMGDIVAIDYAGSIDGVAFEGGTGNHDSLELGSHSFIDGFEEQIVGKNVGDEFDVNVTFPESYHAPELAGKPAVFACKLNDIKVKELPELDDDFVQDVSEFDTVEEYKADVKKSVTEAKEKEAKAAKEDKVIEAIVANATMEIPDAMVDTQARQQAENFAQRLQSQGLSLDTYLQMTGMDVKKFLDTMKPQALKSIQSRLVLEAVAKAENIEATDEDFENEITKMAGMYGMEVDKIKEMIGDEEKKAICEDIAIEKAVNFVTDAAVEE